MFANHVSDWEHTEMRFQNGKPTDLYISVHSYVYISLVPPTFYIFFFAIITSRMGASYAYNESAGTFDFYYGEPLLKTEGGIDVDVPVEYPETVYLVEGSHPEVFSSNGSHGTWGAEG